MSNISSNSLFHFTSRMENLMGILMNGFLPKYSYERTIINSEYCRGTMNSAIPMICFCDLSLSQIKEHISTYGRYGIGMSKDWGIKNKLNPVIYVNDKSSIGNSFSEMVEVVCNMDSTISHLPKEAIPYLYQMSSSFVNLSHFLKPYSGDFRRKGKLRKNVRFYNEREWRYAPPLLKSLEHKIRVSLSLREYNNLIFREKQNEKLSIFRLTYEASDVKYIFIKDSKEILKIIKNLKQMKKNKLTNDEIEILVSKILTSEQILHDF